MLKCTKLIFKGATNPMRILSIFLILSPAAVAKEQIGLRIVDQSGKPIPKSIISFKSNKKRKVFHSKKNGDVEVEMDNIPKLITIEREGFETRNIVVDENDLGIMKKREIELSLKKGKISGRIGDGKKIFASIKVTLHQENGKQIRETISNSSGEYAFNNVPLFGKYRVKILEVGYLPYSSSSIKLRDKEFRKNIYLSTTKHTLVLELRSGKGPLVGIKVNVNGVEKESDHLGMVIFDNCEKFNENIFSIEKYGVSEKFKPEINNYTYRLFNF